MNHRPSSDDFLKGLHERLKPMGFRLRARSQEFTRPFEHGMESVHIAFVRHQDSFSAIVDVALRFDEVEEYVNQDAAWLSPAQKKSTYTLGAEIGNIAGQGQRRWEVTHGTDLTACFDSVMQALSQFGFPYMQRLSDYESAFEALSSAPEKAWLYMPIPLGRAKRAVALSELLGRRSVTWEVVRQQLDFFLAESALCADEFRGFVASRIGAEGA